MNLLLRPYHVLSKYPHLVASDILVWDAFVLKFPSLFDLVTYDLHVGVGLHPSESVAPRLQQMWTTITQKRIDAITTAGTNLFVIEVKDRPGLPALGQVLGYVALIQDLPLAGYNIIPLIVASVIEPDIETAAEFYGVRYYDLSDNHNTLVDDHGNLLNFG